MPQVGYIAMSLAWYALLDKLSTINDHGGLIGTNSQDPRRHRSRS